VHHSPAVGSAGAIERGGHRVRKIDTRQIEGKGAVQAIGADLTRKRHAYHLYRETTAHAHAQGAGRKLAHLRRPETL